LVPRGRAIEVPQHLGLRAILGAAGFGTVAQITRFRVDHALISALVERWRPETHTFHLPWGECTITLEDVVMILGLRVDGMAVTGQSGRFIIGERSVSAAEYAEHYLSVRPLQAWQQLDGFSLRLSWLDSISLRLHPLMAGDELLCLARTYILRLIGGYLIPNKTGDEVSLAYLTLLTDMDVVGRYSWGSAVLANLYRYLCRCCCAGSTQFSGCALLLQTWAWLRIPPLRVHRADELPGTFPLAQR
jgi:hypothetical protein